MLSAKIMHISIMFIQQLLFSCNVIIAISSATQSQPHGIAQIASVNPRHPQIVVDEEKDSIIAISIARIGGCKYSAEIGFRCIERTAKNGLDFKCNYIRIKWKDGECDTKVVYITVYNDNEYEKDEEFLFQLYSLPNNIALGFDKLLITIEENDGNNGEIVIYPSLVSVIEGMSFDLEIKRMFGKINKARVCYQAISGTAKVNFDVTLIEDCVEWNHNEDQSYFITVDTIKDEIWEANEIFYIKLLNVEGAHLSLEYFQSNITIVQNNLNVALLSSTFPPCTKSKKEIQIIPIKGEQFFVQFEVQIPKICTVNNAHIIAQHITESQTSLISIVFKVNGIIMDDSYSTVSCDNIPTSYNVISPPINITVPQLNCTAIINHTLIMDETVQYICDMTAVCVNFDPLKNHPKYITMNTRFERKQRLLCRDVIQGSNNISCECDFPTIYDSDQWFLSNLAFGRKYVSNSVRNEIYEMTQQQQWNNHSLATFMFTIDEYETISNKAADTDVITHWIFYLVTDAFACKETNWSQWSVCDAEQIGIGHNYRQKMEVAGITGEELSCKQMKQHKECVVNQDKTVSFSRVTIRVQEGDDGAIISVRLNHELTSNTTMNKSSLSLDELNMLKGYDVILYFEIPQFFRKEIVIDPSKIGWYKDKWDIIHKLRITAIDDSNLDALQQTIIVSPKIYSLDKEYNDLVVNTLQIIVEDNEKCRYCGLGDVQPFNPVPSPPFWDFKSVFVLVLFLFMICFVGWRIYVWFKRKYRNTNEYDTLRQDGLLDESTRSTTID